jgi:hypothetical protein
MLHTSPKSRYIMIASRITVFKFCLLNVCKREYGILIVSQLGTVRIKGGGFELPV